MPRLSDIDANLLVALDVLLEERHVTRAAQRLGVTQSAMSQTLQRLRQTLDDPVLVRSGTRMVASPRAEAMAGPLRTALQALERVAIGVGGFDPQTAQRTFRLSLLDSYAITAQPRLARLLAESGPGLRVEVIPLDATGVWDAMRNGEVDLAIVGPSEPPADIDTRPFAREHMVGIARAGHPIFDDTLTPERYARWPHAVWRITGRGGFTIDRRLGELGLERRIVAASPYFLSAPAMVADSDLIATVPASAAQVFAARWPIERFAPPLGDPMPYTVYLAWPNFLEADPGHTWLREQMRAIGRAIQVEVPKP